MSDHKNLIFNLIEFTNHRKIIQMEKILTENKNRFVLFPLQHHDIWDYYKKSQQVFWTAEEIDLSQDFTDWEKLNEISEKNFIILGVLFLLAFYLFKSLIVVFYIFKKSKLEANIQYSFSGKLFKHYFYRKK